MHVQFAITVCWLRLAKQTSGDVAHVSLFQLVVFAAHLVDTDILERSDDCFDIETHGDKTVDEVLVVTVVSASSE